MPLLWGHVGLQRQLCDGLAGGVCFHVICFGVMFLCNYLPVSRCSRGVDAAAVVLQANPRMPSLPLLEPIFDIFSKSEVATELECWQLLHALIHHPRVETDAKLKVNAAPLAATEAAMTCDCMQQEWLPFVYL